MATAASVKQNEKISQEFIATECVKSKYCKTTCMSTILSTTIPNGKTLKKKWIFCETELLTGAQKDEQEIKQTDGRSKH